MGGAAPQRQRPPARQPPRRRIIGGGQGHPLQRGPALCGRPPGRRPARLPGPGGHTLPCNFCFDRVKNNLMSEAGEPRGHLSACAQAVASHGVAHIGRGDSSVWAGQRGRGEWTASPVQVDTAARSHQLLCVPMLGTTLAWKARLRDHPCAAPLLRAMDECAARLLLHFEKYLWEKVTAINKCDAPPPRTCACDPLLLHSWFRLRSRGGGPGQ